MLSCVRGICRCSYVDAVESQISSELFPSPLAAWHTGLRDYSSRKYTRAALKGGSNDADNFASGDARISFDPHDQDAQAAAVQLLRALLQLRPLSPFLPASFTAERCVLSHGNYLALKTQSNAVVDKAKEVDGLRTVPVNGLPEIQCMQYEGLAGKRISASSFIRIRVSVRLLMISLIGALPARTLQTIRAANLLSSRKRMDVCAAEGS